MCLFTEVHRLLPKCETVVLYIKGGKKIAGTLSPGLLNFVPWRLTFSACPL
jgi:hypothetical protein